MIKTLNKDKIMKNKDKRNEIFDWAGKQEISAHGIVLSLHDAEILAYEYARRLLHSKGLQ